ncbi:MAG: polysulfide reductase NrfD [Anaerolineales bacterium]|nr:polysulfide reductase NrfD [Chloroflexota bacterium]MBL6983037.1 polysulfide reductase NrfD [Anaerolineales bacterium]
MAENTQATRKYYVWVSILGIAILAGLVTAFQVFTKGLGIYGGNDTLVWTLPIAAYVFFALTSTGLTLVASIPTVFGVKQFDLVAKRAIYLAIASLIAAFISLGLDLGSLSNLIHFLTSPNMASPMWWMGALYVLEVILLGVKFWRMQVSDLTSRFYTVLSVLAFLVAIAASSTLGVVFGSIEARPSFFGEFMPVYFLLNALLSGLAVIILSNLIKKIDPVEDFSNLLRVVLGLALILFVWRTFVGLNANSPEYASFKHMSGTWLFQVEFWLGLVLPFLLLLVPVFRDKVWAKFATAGLVLAGLFVRGLLLVESGLSIPGDPRLTGVPGIATVSYTVWEWLVFVFALAVLFLLYTIGDKYFDLETA